MAHRAEPRGKKDAIQEFLSLNLQIDELHPEADPEKLFFRRYRVAYYVRPDDCIPCHLCQLETPLAPPIYIQGKKVAGHCSRTHGKKRYVACEYKKCPVQFMNTEDKEKHIIYIHEKPYGWWILN